MDEVQRFLQTLQLHMQTWGIPIIVVGVILLGIGMILGNHGHKESAMRVCIGAVIIIGAASFATWF